MDGHEVAPGRYELWASTNYGAIGAAPNVNCTTADGLLRDARDSTPTKGRECYVFREGTPVSFEIKANATDMAQIEKIKNAPAPAPAPSTPAGGNAGSGASLASSVSAGAAVFAAGAVALAALM
jgi:hypothetical protein